MYFLYNSRFFNKLCQKCLFNIDHSFHPYLLNKKLREEKDSEEWCQHLTHVSPFLWPERSTKWVSSQRAAADKVCLTTLPLSSWYISSLSISASIYLSPYRFLNSCSYKCCTVQYVFCDLLHVLETSSTKYSNLNPSFSTSVLLLFVFFYIKLFKSSSDECVSVCIYFYVCFSVCMLVCS